MTREIGESSDHWRDLGLLVLRAGASALLLTHGIPKLQKLMAGGEIRFFDFLGLGPATSLALAVVGEAVAPVLVLAGFLTRWAAMPAVFTMGVAATVVHRGDPLKDRELALLYLLAFAVLALTGPGRYSLDAWRSARRGAALER